MKLGIDKIKEITLGAVRIENNELYRFTKEQQDLYERYYKESNEGFYSKVFSQSGMKFQFETDSERLFIDVLVKSASSRKYFSFDVFVNGECIDYLDNFEGEKLQGNYTQKVFRLGEFSKEFELGKGIKKVTVYLPWSVSTQIKEISVDDGSFVKGIKPSKKLLAFGDSITQGYDAVRPSNRYISKICDSLDAEEFNKAIGGERFFPELAKLKDDFVPDYITVAYGTNDWSTMDEQEFKEKCREFYENLRNTYNETPIFALAPICRKDMGEERKFGPFENVSEIIKEITKDIENVTFINCVDFLPCDEKYFADGYLHPNDSGFDCYFGNLLNAMK